MVTAPSDNFFPSSTEQSSVARPLLMPVFLLPILTHLLYVILNPPPPHNPFLLGLATRSWSPPTIITARRNSTRPSFPMGSSFPTRYLPMSRPHTSLYLMHQHDLCLHELLQFYHKSSSRSMLAYFIQWRLLLAPEKTNLLLLHSPLVSPSMINIMRSIGSFVTLRDQFLIILLSSSLFCCSTYREHLPHTFRSSNGYLYSKIAS